MRIFIFFLTLLCFPSTYSMEKLLKLVPNRQSKNDIISTATKMITGEMQYDNFASIDKENLKSKINEKRGDAEETLLHIAIKNRRLDIVKTLISLGAEQKRNKWGEFPIHYAALYDLPILQYLVSINIPVDVADKKKQTPIFFVKTFEGLKILLERRLSLLVKNNCGEYPVFCALKNRAEKQVIMQMLIALTQGDADFIKNLRDNEGTSLLHIAAECSDEFWLVKLLEFGIPVNCLNKRNETPLFRAAVGSNVATASYLIQNAADIDTKTGEGETALHKAAQAGSADLVKILLASSAKPNVPNKSESRTPLHFAVIAGNVDAVGWLLAAGADQRFIDVNYMSPYILAEKVPEVLSLLNDKQRIEQYKKQLIPESAKFVQQESNASLLHLAARDDHNKITTLLNAGAPVDAVDAAGETPLHWAIKARKKVAVEILLSRGASVTARNAQGFSAIFLAIKHFTEIYDWLLQQKLPFEIQGPVGMLHIHTAAAHSLFLLQKLLSRGNSLESVDDHGNTPIFYALNAGNQQTFDLILPKVRLDHENREGETPLIAAASQSAYFVRKLLSARAPIHSKLGRTTALHKAIKSSDAENVILLLLGTGLKIDTLNALVRTPLMIAARERANLIEFLVKSCHATLEIEDGSKNRAMHHAAQADNSDAITILLALGALPDEKNSLGATPLALAIKAGAKRAIKILEPHASFDDLKTKDMYARVPQLHRNIIQGDLNAMRQTINDPSMLLNTVVTSNVRGPFDRTGMHIAAMRSPQVIKGLHAMGGELNDVDYYGATPLHYAAVCSPEGTSILIELCAKLNIQDKEGNTAGHYAAMTKLAALQLLIAAGIDTSLRNFKQQSLLDVALLTNNTDCALYLSSNKIY